MRKLIALTLLLFSVACNSANMINYPVRAERLRIGGEVNVLYDVNAQGRTENIRFISAEPNHVFNRSVKQQMRFWIFPEQEPQKNVPLKIIFKQN